MDSLGEEVEAEREQADNSVLSRGQGERGHGRGEAAAQGRAKGRSWGPAQGLFHPVLLPLPSRETN